ncbi:unnamed protein product [Moneuplotes crassus]|uniref:Uncharacterized protein n=1 Tax=Euplotes crassus TaxID=5936 RepID=A0AAD2D910_EUPCR|nr:unnamed protein product [Moneuplotes crassus]
MSKHHSSKIRSKFKPSAKNSSPKVHLPKMYRSPGPEIQVTSLCDESPSNAGMSEATNNEVYLSPPQDFKFNNTSDSQLNYMKKAFPIVKKVKGPYKKGSQVSSRMTHDVNSYIAKGPTAAVSKQAQKLLQSLVEDIDTFHCVSCLQKCARAFMKNIRKMGGLSLEELDVKDLSNRLSKNKSKASSSKVKFLKQFLSNPKERKEFYKHESKNLAVIAPLLYKEMVEQYYNSHTEVDGERLVKVNLDPQKPFVPVKRFEKDQKRCKSLDYKIPNPTKVPKLKEKLKKAKKAKNQQSNDKSVSSITRAPSNSTIIQQQRTNLSRKQMQYYKLIGTADIEVVEYRGKKPIPQKKYLLSDRSKGRSFEKTSKSSNKIRLLSKDSIDQNNGSGKNHLPSIKVSRNHDSKLSRRLQASKTHKIIKTIQKPDSLRKKDDDYEWETTNGAVPHHVGMDLRHNKELNHDSAMSEEEKYDYKKTVFPKHISPIKNAGSHQRPSLKKQMSTKIQMENIEKNLYSDRSSLNKEFDQMKHFANKNQGFESRNYQKLINQTETRRKKPLQLEEKSLDDIAHKMEKLLAQVPLEKRGKFLLNFLPSPKISSESSKGRISQEDIKNGDYTMFVDSSQEQSSI